MPGDFRNGRNQIRQQRFLERRTFNFERRSQSRGVGQIVAQAREPLRFDRSSEHDRLRDLIHDNVSEAASGLDATRTFAGRQAAIQAPQFSLNEGSITFISGPTGQLLSLLLSHQRRP